MNTNIQKNIIDVFGDNINLYSSRNIGLEQIRFLIENKIIVPIDRLSILNQDETINKIIPQKDIINQSLSYQENYQSGTRRSLSVRLINNPIYFLKTNYNEKYLQKNISENLPYTPDVNNIWYGTKFKYDIGFEYNGEEFFFSRGIYVVSNFSFGYGSQGSYVDYELNDKFYIYEDNTGTLIDGYQIATGVLVCEAIKAIQNLPCADGVVFDIKQSVIHNSYSDFVTQQTIALSSGEKISNILDQIAIQMSAEYYYNNEGYLVFTPIDASMNELDKPIIWDYEFDNIDDFNLSGDQQIENVVKVIGTNINDESIHIGIAKNTNLNSATNIYYIKERCGNIIEDSNIYSDDQANELAQYYLRQNTLQQFTQQLKVPYNPLLQVNNIIRITVKRLKIIKERFLITSISYNSRSNYMSLTVVNINELPIIGGV